ncbi:MAG: hypothetical protein LBL93_02130 [Ruminococcus sp.]|jgi:hypothetical protein|nr:hypothetical protein [Ruminococcus sp.]
MTKKELEKIIKSGRAVDIKYNGKTGYIDPIDYNLVYLTFDSVTKNSNFANFIRDKFINSKSLSQIYEEIEFSY